jgi:hypothetical protein
MEDKDLIRYVNYIKKNIKHTENSHYVISICHMLNKTMGYIVMEQHDKFMKLLFENIDFDIFLAYLSRPNIVEKISSFNEIMEIALQYADGESNFMSVINLFLAESNINSETRIISSRNAAGYKFKLDRIIEWAVDINHIQILWIIVDKFKSFYKSDIVNAILRKDNVDVFNIFGKICINFDIESYIINALERKAIKISKMLMNEYIQNTDQIVNTQIILSVFKNGDEELINLIKLFTYDCNTMVNLICNTNVNLAQFIEINNSIIPKMDIKLFIHNYFNLSAIHYSPNREHIFLHFLKTKPECFDSNIYDKFYIGNSCWPNLIKYVVVYKNHKYKTKKYARYTKHNTMIQSIEEKKQIMADIIELAKRKIVSTPYGSNRLNMYLRHNSAGQSCYPLICRLYELGKDADISDEDRKSFDECFMGFGRITTGLTYNVLYKLAAEIVNDIEN